MLEDDSGGNSPEQVNRRSLLRSVGVAGVAASGLFTSAAKGNSPGGNKRTYEELEGMARGRVISAALSDGDFKALLRALGQRGWKPIFGEATCNRHETESGETYTALVVEAERKGKRTQHDRDQEAVLVWIDVDDTAIDLPHHTFAHIVDPASDPETTSKFWGYEQLQVLKPKQGRVTATTSEFPEAPGDSETRRESNVPRALGHRDDEYDCECSMEFAVFEQNLSWSCIIRTVIGGIGTGLSCGACVIDPSKITCIGCVISYGLTSDQLIQCTGGYTADRVVCKCVDPDWADEHNLNCYDGGNIPAREYEKIPGEEVSSSGGCS